MIYGRSTISRYSKSNIFVWMLMAWQAGFINAGSFIACGRFVSHLTGFSTQVGIEAAQGDMNLALGFAIVPAFFLVGAMISGFFVDLKIKQNRPPQYFNSFFLMVLILAGVAYAGTHNYFGPFGEPIHNYKDFYLLIPLCLLCGIQNGTITTVSNSVIRTTHLTGITTDLGIGLVRLLFKKKMPPEFVVSEERKANLMRIGIVFFFTLGALHGSKIFHRFAYYGFTIPLATSAFLVLIMIYFRIIHEKQKVIWDKLFHH